LEYPFEGCVPLRFDPKLERSAFVGEFDTYYSKTQTVTLVGVDDLGVALVIVPHGG
jgi:hypothetical protein